MKKIILTALAASTLATSAFASDFYGRVDAGVSRLDVKTNDGVKAHTNRLLISLGLGMQVIENVRGELDFSYVIPKKDDTKILNFGLTGYYDFPIDSPVKPFVLAGLGATHFHNSGDSNDTKFAWKVGAGLGYNITETVTADLTYNFKRLAKVKSAHLNSHTITLGARVGF